MEKAGRLKGRNLLALASAAKNMMEKLLEVTWQHTKSLIVNQNSDFFIFCCEKSHLQNEIIHERLLCIKRMVSENRSLCAVHAEGGNSADGRLTSRNVDRILVAKLHIPDEL